MFVRCCIRGGAGSRPEAKQGPRWRRNGIPRRLPVRTLASSKAIPAGPSFSGRSALSLPRPRWPHNGRTSSLTLRAFQVAACAVSAGGSDPDGILRSHGPARCVVERAAPRRRHLDVLDKGTRSA
ncbi:hypothetical protein MTO96_022885 [Rhipicephalus appendiculatus]